MSCTRCSKSHSTVQAFLLTCNGCSRKWHHRCHIPLVSDQELILRIKAHNSGDSENGLQAWKCKRCTRGGTASVSVTPAPQASPAPPPPQPQSISRRPSLRSIPPSESRQPTSAPQSVIHISDSSDNPPQLGGFQSQGGGQGRADSSVPSKRRFSHKDNDIIVIDDSDSDSSRHASTKRIQMSTRGMTKRSTIDRPTTHISKTTHPLAQEEEESSDSSNGTPAVTEVPSRLTSDQPPQSAPPKQRPAHAGVKRVDNGPGDTNITTTSSQPLSKPEKETMRDQFRRDAAEKEKRRRLEHRQRQQQILQAKIEEKELIEGITLNVVDLDLNNNNNRQAHATPTEQPLPPALTSSETGDLPLEIIATTASTPTKAVNEPSFAFDWIGARANSDDIWARALRKKDSTTSPSLTRRKITARKLGDARPQLFQFDASQWIGTAKGGRR